MFTQYPPNEVAATITALTGGTIGIIGFLVAFHMHTHQTGTWARPNNRTALTLIMISIGFSGWMLAAATLSHINTVIAGTMVSFAAATVWYGGRVCRDADEEQQRRSNTRKAWMILGDGKPQEVWVRMTDQDVADRIAGAVEAARARVRASLHAAAHDHLANQADMPPIHVPIDIVGEPKAGEQFRWAGPPTISKYPADFHQTRQDGDQ